MSVDRLKSITIQDFRSIGGEITIPLDAQVVLIHGPNGTGKTSTLSAIEFALAGSVDSLRRVDPNYLDHLVHRGATHTNISVNVEMSGKDLTHALRFAQGDDLGIAPILQDTEAHFFSERCYLAQSTLGRLLEIYAERDGDQNSPLTRFVNDVLGLDTLEALTKGLNASKDIRNTRNLVPGIAALEREVAMLTSDKAAKKARRDRLAQAQARILQDIEPGLRLLGSVAYGSDVAVAMDRLATTEDTSGDISLVELTGYRREIESLLQRLSSVKQTSLGVDLAALEERAHESSSLTAEWQTKVGQRIEKLLEQARGEFPDLASLTTSSPAMAVSTALARISAELESCSSRLHADAVDRDRLDELIISAEADGARIALIDEQTATVTAGAGEIAKLLAALGPHIHNSECIVCGRDYSEISEEPLSAQLARRAAQLSDQAERLAELNRAKHDAATSLSNITSEMKLIEARILQSSVRSLLVSREAQFQDWQNQLSARVADAELGTKHLRETTQARMALATARNDAGAWIEVRNSASGICQKLSIDPPSDVEPIDSLLDRISTHIRTLMTEGEERLAARTALKDSHRTWMQLTNDLSDVDVEHSRLDSRLKELLAERDEFERRRNGAKQLLKVATEVQQKIIREVFNDSLNSVWRDLFVRLAPKEPFVPAFRVAEGRKTSPQLTTVHRAGGTGGSPGAMLSAGNLNTAALTLFLALHLTAGEKLPLLVLDDPVQSMDDVHISQFAALLRTLSKQHSRQVIVAVHERALFDYLALELSPAFDGDRLITVELKKQSDGTSFAAPSYHFYSDDPVHVSA
ncbi:AAA family ATPase [Arthrobacter sp. OY3WO11]|uniref:AAA family ATPase n=1 Tax=Arthrobacter sp. OY3WO11 TaxID=1835723 RepID=UPI000A51E4B5|nr:AAA family ATPase [Arthrobacter sp. OY3WO11]